MQISLRKLFLLFIFLFFSVVGFKGKTSLVPDAKYFKKLFDYNPMYKGLEGAITDSIALHGKPEHHHETIVIPLHGFGETSPGGWDVRFSVKKNNESIDIARTISFGFKDTKLMKYLDDFQKAKAAKKAGMVILQGLLLKLAKAARDINIGQTLDAEVALYPLIELARFGYKGTVVFFAHSRGGTTLIRLLDMVANPQNYKKTWKKFGITPKRENKKIKKIYEMLQKGKHFLVHPLLDLGLALKKIGEGNLIKSGLLVPVMKAGLMVGTKYTFKLKQPIEILEHLSTQEEQFNLHFILTYPDDMVTNELDGKLKQLVDKTNGSWMVDIWKKKELKEKRIAEIVKVMLRNEALKLAQTNEIAKKYVRENIDAYIENTIFNFKMKAKEKKLKRKLSNQEKLDLLREYLKNRHKAKLRAEIAKLLKTKQDREIETFMEEHIDAYRELNDQFNNKIKHKEKMIRHRERIKRELNSQEKMDIFKKFLTQEAKKKLDEEKFIEDPHNYFERAEVIATDYLEKIYNERLKELEEEEEKREKG